MISIPMSPSRLPACLFDELATAIKTMQSGDSPNFPLALETMASPIVIVEWYPNVLRGLGERLEEGNMCLAKLAGATRLRKKSGYWPDFGEACHQEQQVHLSKCSSQGPSQVSLGGLF